MPASAYLLQSLMEYIHVQEAEEPAPERTWGEARSILGQVPEQYTPHSALVLSQQHPCVSQALAEVGRNTALKPGPTINKATPHNNPSSSRPHLG